MKENDAINKNLPNSYPPRKQHEASVPSKTTAARSELGFWLDFYRMPMHPLPHALRCQGRVQQSGAMQRVGINATGLEASFALGRRLDECPAGAFSLEGKAAAAAAPAVAVGCWLLRVTASDMDTDSACLVA